MAQDINKRVCTRCGGTGEYSFNLKYGTRCYGCGGTGWQIVAPKGQKKVKPTADLNNCKVGDIIEVNKVLAEVTSIKWIKHNEYNQVVRYTRLVDGGKFKTWRTFRLWFKRESPITYDEYIAANSKPGGMMPVFEMLKDLWADMIAMYPNGTYGIGAKGKVMDTNFQVTIRPTDDMVGKEVE